MSFKVLCDVHIALKITKFIENKGYEAEHVNNILDSYYTKDSAIRNYADENDFIVLTKDYDFKDSHFLNNSPKKLLHITLGNIPTSQLIQLLDEHLDQIITYFQSEKCFIEIGEGYIKVVK